jgi:hypothetical protein
MPRASSAAIAELFNESAVGSTGLSDSPSLASDLQTTLPQGWIISDGDLRIRMAGEDAGPAALVKRINSKALSMEM